ncbi:MAG: DUF6883 domain-containing protein [Solirubrobacterales bacterium]
MPWPPRKGELLPRFDEPVGIEEKLRNYTLVLDHEDGGPKAKGFRDMLGIEIAAIDYLVDQIVTGIAVTPISAVRPRKPDAVACTVEFRIAGIGRYSHREAWVRTGWRLDEPGARPRFSTAIPRGKRKR